MTNSRIGRFCELLLARLCDVARLYPASWLVRRAAGLFTVVGFDRVRLGILRYAHLISDASLTLAITRMKRVALSRNESRRERIGCSRTRLHIPNKLLGVLTARHNSEWPRLRGSLPSRRCINLHEASRNGAEEVVTHALDVAWSNVGSQRKYCQRELLGC